jgi:ABC-2 type transport system permease protein
VQPLAVDFFAREVFYLDLVIKLGDQVQRVLPRSELTEADLRKAFEAAVRRLTPGQLKTVAIYTQIPEPPPPNPQIPPQFQPPPPRPDYQALRQMLQADYNIENIDMADGVVPGNIDVLIIGKPGALTDNQLYAIDQFLMRGGKIVTFAGNWSISASQQGLESKQNNSAFLDMLATYGVRVEGDLVLDPQNAQFPMPKTERRGPFNVQTIELVDYPFFADIRQDGFEKGHPALSGLQNVSAPWASSLTLTGIEGVDAQPLLNSSGGSWTQSSGDINNFGTPGSTTGSEIVAATLTGTFPSHYTDKPSPLFAGAAGEGDGTGRTMKTSLADARLVVLGSSEMVSDIMMQIASQGGDVHRNNLTLLQNLVDWSMEDNDLLQIRASGVFARTLYPMDTDAQRTWETGQYLLGLLLLVLVGILPRRSRASARSIITAADISRAAAQESK